MGSHTSCATASHAAIKSLFCAALVAAVIPVGQSMGVPTLFGQKQAFTIFNDMEEQVLLWEMVSMKVRRWDKLSPLQPGETRRIEKGYGVQLRSRSGKTCMQLMPKDSNRLRTDGPFVWRLSELCAGVWIAEQHAAAAATRVAVTAVADPTATPTMVVSTDADDLVELLEMSTFVLLEWFAPWCGHCKKLQPQLEAAAVELRASHPEVVVAAIDAIANAELAKEHNVRGFPTLFWYREGNPTPFTGERSSTAIVEWVASAVAPSAELLLDPEALHRFTSSATMPEVIDVIAFIDGLGSGEDDGDDSAAAASASATAALLERVAFAFAADREGVRFGIARRALLLSHPEGLALQLETDGLVVYKPDDVFGEQRVVLSGDEFALATVEEVEAFVRAHRVPLVLRLSESTESQVFGRGAQRHLFVFADDVDAVSNETSRVALLATLADVARDYRADLAVATVPLVDANGYLYSFFQVDVEAVRAGALAAWFWDTSRGADGAKLRYEFGTAPRVYEHDPPTAPLSLAAFTPDALRDFVQSCMRGEAAALLRSEGASSVGVGGDGKVIRVASVTLERDVIDNNKHVLVLIRTPYCKQCAALEKGFEALALYYAANASVVVATIDASRNEHALLPNTTTDFPLLAYSPIGSSELSFDSFPPIGAGFTQSVDALLAPLDTSIANYTAYLNNPF